MSSSEGGSSSEDENEASCSRKFEISKIIEAYLDPTSGNLSRQWTFVFDDGMFERQANFVTQVDLWRHLDRIDAGMTKLRMKAKKGTSRLYFAESADAWTEQTATANKWIIRFSRKFPTDLADFWVKLVLSILSNRIPDSDLVLGCSFTTKKGKSEMAVYLLEPPDGIEPENDYLMRDCMGVDRREKTIQFTFKSYRAQLQQEADEARVNQVKQKKAHTWPLLANNIYDQEEELAACKQKMCDETEMFEKAHREPFRYVFESVSTPSSSSLSIPPSFPSVPTLSLEELQELQLQHLKLCASDTDEKPAKEEPEEDAMPEIGTSNKNLTPKKSPKKEQEEKMLRLSPAAVPKIINRSFPFSKDECDADFERRMLYDSPEDESLLESPHKILPKNCSPPEFVLGTNPPDFSSPLMRVAMSKNAHRAFHRKLSL